MKKFTLLSQAFSVKLGEITPTLKLRRKVIMERYRHIIDSMYSNNKENKENKNKKCGEFHRTFYFDEKDLFDFYQHTFLVRFQYANLTKLNTGFFAISKISASLSGLTAINKAPEV